MSEEKIIDLATQAYASVSSEVSNSEGDNASKDLSRPVAKQGVPKQSEKKDMGNSGLFSKNKD